MSAETIAASSSQKSAAPGFRMTKPPRTAGMSQTPEMRYCAAGRASKAGEVAAQRAFQAQNTTPNATAITAATTMSTVRQAVMEDGARRSAMVTTPYADMTQIRFEGLRSPALSAAPLNGTRAKRGARGGAAPLSV